MQRKATKQSRGPNSCEKRFHAHIKECECAWCGNPGPSIVDHVKGSTFKHNKVLIGHWFVLPQCEQCDHKKTIGGEKLGNTADKWFQFAVMYHRDFEIPVEVVASINHWGTTWQA